MPVIRGHHNFDDHFTQIPNDWLRDARLSFKARGLLSLVMSHRQGWSLSIASLAEQNQEGRDAIRSAIAELENYGYLTRSQVNESGRFGESVWTTYDPTDLPSSENPSSDNPTPKKTIYKEEQVKNNIQAQFEEFWNAYPRKLDKAKAFRAFKSALTRAKFEDVLAGVLAYRNDPKRNPDFTKYPASWLNAGSWENAAGSNEVIQATNERRERELERTKEFLEEQKRLDAQSTPAPKCPHGSSIVRCEKCLKTIG